MQTIKIVRKGLGTVILPASGAVAIVRPGDADWDSMVDAAKETDFTPQAAISHGGGSSTDFIYHGDRAWIMNEVGKTVYTL